jgi:hypothetical protein
MDRVFYYMIQSLLNKTGLLPDGHKKDFKSFYDNGNLIYLRQRMDIGGIEGDRNLPSKVFLKIGKTKLEGNEFIEKITKEGKLEIPQQFYTAYPDTIREIRKELLKREIKQRREQGNYNYEFFMYEEIKQTADIIKEMR